MPSDVIKEGAGLEAEASAEGWGGKLRRSEGAVRVAACLGTGLAILLATGCSGSSGGIAQPLASTTSDPISSSPTSSAPPGSVSQQVLAQYRAFWSALTPASRAPASEREAMLSPYTGNPELDSLLHGMAAADTKGQVFYGVDAPRPRLLRLSVQKGVAVVDDCQDSSHSGLADKKTGRHLTVGVARNHVVVTMHLADDGRWRVAFVSFSRIKC